MSFATNPLSRLAAGLFLGLTAATTLLAEPRADALAAIVGRIEDNLGGRVGLVLRETGGGFLWQHRADDRFLMNSTVKAPLCGAVLARRDAGLLSLTDELPVRAGDMVDYAPVTETHLGGAMSIGDLCLAAIDMSDNTATNLLIDHLGGPQAVTEYFAGTGDTITRLDRREPGLNTFAKGDPRDTTTPAAMAQMLEVLLLGDALKDESRDQLAQWMAQGSVTGALLRKAAPQGWAIFDKSGSGSHNRNIIGMVVPESGRAWIVTIFLSDVDAGFATRDAALQELSAAVIAVIGG